MMPISWMIWLAGCVWARRELPSPEAFFEKANVRWLRAMFSVFLVPQLWVAFRPETRDTVMFLVAFTPAAYAMSLRFHAPQKWVSSPPLLRTLLYGVGFFSLVCVLIPKDLQNAYPSSTLEVPTWITVLLVALAAALVVPCMVQFAQAGGTPEPLDPPQHLVTTGYYRFMSHPILYGELLAIFAGVTAFPSNAGWAYAIGISVFLRLGWVPIEDTFFKRRIPSAPMSMLYARHGRISNNPMDTHSQRTTIA